jgi:hypothetical protein
MTTPMEQLLRFLFIPGLAIAATVGGLVALFAVGALFDFLDNPTAGSRAVEALFRRPARPSKTAGPEHYYRPYWVK